MSEETAPARESHGDHCVVLDKACFTDLAEQLASHEDAAEFVAVFLKMLPGRVHAIEEPLLGGDGVQAARTAALSLGSSAALIGAEQVGRDATLISCHLKAGSLEEARNVAVRLQADARSLSAALEDLLAGQEVFPNGQDKDEEGTRP